MGVNLKFTVRILVPFIVILVTYSSVASAQRPQQTNNAQLEYCERSDTFSNQVFHTTQYWQIQNPAQKAREIYYVDNTVDSTADGPVDYKFCGLFVIDEGKQMFYHKQGDAEDLEGLSYLSADDATQTCYDNLGKTTDWQTDFKEDYGITMNVTGKPLAPIAATNITYPEDILLAPAFNGIFPRLVTGDVSITPYKDRGFYYEVPIADVTTDTGIAFPNQRIEYLQAQQITNFYLNKLGSNWQKVTGDVDNPLISHAGSLMSLTLMNTQNNDTLLLEFAYDDDKDVLDVTVVEPLAPAEQTGTIPPVDSTIDSNWNSQFVGWDQLGDRQISTLEISFWKNPLNGHYRIVELSHQDSQAKVVKWNEFTQEQCDPSKFLPTWASTSP